MLSTRSKLSLCQLLARANQSDLAILVEKHGLQPYHFTGSSSKLIALRDELVYRAEEPQFNALLDEVLRTKGDWIQDWEEDDERWQDFLRCVELDGYRVEEKALVPIEPRIEGAAPVEDDLRTELDSSNLPRASDVKTLLDASAADYRSANFNYNGCLTNARAALQTLGTEIAKARQATHGGNFDETKWGQIVSYLRTSGMITDKEEEAVAGVFSFVSPGAHTLVGLDEREMARLGRSLVAHMSYFLVKKHNA